jgi:hypothetical protein
MPIKISKASQVSAKKHKSKRQSNAVKAVRKKALTSSKLVKKPTVSDINKKRKK